MQTFPLRSVRLVFWQRRLLFVCLSSLLLFGLAPQISLAQVAQQSRQAGPPLRIPRQQAQGTAALDGVVRSGAGSAPQSPVAGAVLTLRNIVSNATTQTT